ncbi:MAG: hypothetical protein NTX88_10595 [Candidatus Atribacteria bacterium]|nr:hypothetical protein [Candidatus Atribacteria bacterium]
MEGKRKDRIVILGGKDGFVVTSEEAPDFIIGGKNLVELVGKVGQEVMRRNREKKISPDFEGPGLSIMGR